VADYMEFVFHEFLPKRNAAQTEPARQRNVSGFRENVPKAAPLVPS